MRRIGLVFDPLFKQHNAGFGHPERPARLDAVEAALEWSGLLATAKRIVPQPIAREKLVRLHTPEYVDRIESACRAGRAFIDDPDSGICGESFEIALHASGAVCELARQVAAREVQAGFCAIRPPGHHAERDRSMGFCLFNHVALAADALRSELGYQRILILDWDVHHGNGTQHLFEADSTVFFISLHGDPRHLYPGTGFADEIGVGAGAGFTLNLPMAPGAQDADYHQAFEQTILPAVDRFEPEFVLISAGFDAHADDPLGNVRLSDDAFVWMSRVLVDIAERHAGGRVLSVLEGGYNLEVLRRCVAEHVEVLERGK